MAAPEPQPRAVETPLPIVMADAPPLDEILGVTTTDDGEWATTPARQPVTRSDIGAAFLIAGLSKARYTVLKCGWHRRRMH